MPHGQPPRSPGRADPWGADCSRRLPDWNHVDAELRRRGVTLRLLWEQTCMSRGAAAPVRRCAGPHVAGGKLFVDYAGDEQKRAGRAPGRDAGYLAMMHHLSNGDL